jgi:uncharacterized protein YndB with AHSA1/START domain
MPDADATIQEQGGRTLLRFERVLRHPPERVWSALTEPQELAAWHPSPGEFEPREGGTVRYSAQTKVPDLPDGEVTDWEPPRLLGYTWGDDHLRWEVREHDDGSLLTLTHSFDDHFKVARDAAGWHVCLDRLTSMLDGALAGSEQDDQSRPLGWRELNSAYEARFGIPHDKATPPPADPTGGG